MEKVVKPFDKEFMRMAMLKHEETFREQVYELHRLYRIQKTLMNNIGVKQQNIQQKQDDHRGLADEMIMMIRKRSASNAFDNQRPQAQRNTEDRVGLRVGDHSHAVERIAESNNNNYFLSVLDESEVELTLSLGPSTHNPRQPKTDKSESNQSLSSSSTGSSQTRKTSPKNIISSTRSERDFTWGSANNNNFPHQGSEIDPGFANRQPNNPPWMFQALSLKLS